MKRDQAARFTLMLARHPIRCFVVALLLTIGSLLSIRRELRIETDLTALLPKNSPVAATTREALRDFGGFDFMYCVLEAPGPGNRSALIEAAPQLAAALYDRSLLSEVTYRYESQKLEFAGPEGRVRVLSLMTEAEWNDLDARVNTANISRRITSIASFLNLPESAPWRDKIVRDPLGVFDALDDRREIFRGPLKLNLNDGYFLSADESMLLILMKPRKPSTDLLFSNNLKQFVEETRDAAFLRHPEWRDTLKISFYGTPIEAVAEANQLRKDARRTASLAGMLVLVLFIAVFRRPEALVFTLAPTMLAVLWTVGATALVVGRLTQVTATFAAILIGLGVDYSIHIYNRFLEEVRLGRPLDESVNTAIERTSASNAAGAFTTALAFFAMTFTSFLGFSELGTVLGMGILMSLLASWLVLPGLLRILGRMELGLVNRRPLPGFGLRRVRFLVTAYPRVTLLGCLTIAAFLALYARDISFDQTLRNLRQTNTEYDALRQRIEDRFSSPGSQVIALIEGDTLEEALSDNDLLYRRIIAARSAYPILSVDSLRALYPSEEVQRRSLTRMARFNTAQLEAELGRIATTAGLEAELFTPFVEQMRDLQNLAIRLGDSPDAIVSFDTMRDPTFESLVQSYVVHRPDVNRYRIATQIYPTKGEWESKIPDGFQDELAKDLKYPIQFTGLTVIWEELQRLMIRDLALIALLSISSLSIFLVLYFRNLKNALLSALPVFIGLVCTLGLADATGIELNYINIIAFPIVIGIGIDAGFHLLQRYTEMGSRDLRIPIERTGRAIVLSSLSTCFGFAALSTAGFRSLREIGVLIIFGIMSTLIAALVMLPAILRLLGERNSVYTGGPGDELG